MAIKYKICPKCESKDSVKILYGYPNEKGIMLEAAGKAKLGGCLVLMWHQNIIVKIVNMNGIRKKLFIMPMEN